MGATVAIAEWKTHMPIQMDVVVGHIEKLTVDAVVNAANAALLPGGGVDGAIRRAAGPKLDALLAAKVGLREGAALVTPAFRLPARYVIHTVAPIYFAPGDRDEKIALLRSCYGACLAAARAHGCASIAFPAIGTGAFGWPKKLGCSIAVESVRESRTSVCVTFCCFSEEDASLYRAELARP
jgi:O-acetyl-ADP-ribose deacetylase (regulator of RNase III)